MSSKFTGRSDPGSRIDEENHQGDKHGSAPLSCSFSCSTDEKVFFQCGFEGGGYHDWWTQIFLAPAMLLLKLESIEIRSTCQMDQGHQRLGKVALAMETPISI